MGNIKDNHKLSKFGFDHNDFWFSYANKTKEGIHMFTNLNRKAESLCKQNNLMAT